MVQILLATYNGERHLPAQLQSLLDQTSKDWTLFIRDDNSTDRTPAIIEEFAAKHPDKVRIVHDHDDGRPNDNLGGASQNFGRLLKLSADPYVMFCDQDDVWDPKKIAMSMAKMQELESRYGAKTPLLVHTDFAVTDADNHVKLPSYDHGRKLHKHRTGLNRLLVDNVITGMSVTMNRPLIDKAMPIPPDKVMHDWWMGLVAASFGQIGYVDEPLVNYRQHGNNVVGVSTDTRSFVQRATAKLKNNLATPGEVRRIVEDKSFYAHKALERAADVATELRDRFGGEMRENDKELVDAVITLPSQSHGKQMRTMMHYGLLPGNRREAAERLLVPFAERHLYGTDKKTGRS